MAGCWDIARPELIVAARAKAAGAALRRIIGDHAADGAEMREAVTLARTAAEACAPHLEGRPLYAGHAGWDWPSGDEPHLQLWHAITLLREFRGDGHIAALTAAGLGGCEALVSHGATGDVPPSLLQQSRGWSDEAWAAATDRLRERGLLDDGGAHRRAIEDTTDRLSLAPWEALGQDGCDRLRALVRPWSKAVVESGELFGGGGGRQPA
jgi:hypothetical protein